MNGAPTKKVGQPTKKVGQPTKKVGQPTKKVAQPTKKVGQPTKKIGEPTKTIGTPTKKYQNFSSQIVIGFKKINIKECIDLKKVTRLFIFYYLIRNTNDILLIWLKNLRHESFKITIFIVY
jgi:hypothetical protein